MARVRRTRDLTLGPPNTFSNTLRLLHTQIIRTSILPHPDLEISVSAAHRHNMNTNVHLLACLVESEDAIHPDVSHYRFLVDDEHVKYVTTAPGSLDGEEFG